MYKEGTYWDLELEKESDTWTLYSVRIDNEKYKVFGNLKSKNTLQVTELVGGTKYKYLYNDDKKLIYGFWKLTDTAEKKSTPPETEADNIDTPKIDINSESDVGQGVVIAETGWLNKQFLIGHVSNGGGIIKFSHNKAIKFTASANSVMLQLIDVGIGKNVATQSWQKTKAVKEQKKLPDIEISQGEVEEL